MKKFAVCFSGYPRFVKKCFNNIKKNLLDGLGEYDVYANFQWDEDWKTKQIHHEFNDKYDRNELEDFIQLYTPFNLRSINVIKPYDFDFSKYKKTSLESDMILTLDESKNIIYRTKCQYQGVLDCVKLVNLSDYEYIIRVRTDNIFESELDFSQLESDHILCESGKVAGFDRNFSDWFFIVPSYQSDFFSDLANVEEHYKDGIIHMHKLVEKVGMKYNIQEYEFNVYTASIYSYMGQETFLESKK